MRKCLLIVGTICLSDAISIENRYFTSAFSNRSYASLTFWIGITSTSEVMLCFPQKSSISCVSAIPPISEPDRLRRAKIRLNDDTGIGFSGAPTKVQIPVAPQQPDSALMSWSAETAVQNEVETARMLRHLVGVSRNDHLVRAQPNRVILLVRRSREQNDMCAKSMGKLHAHMAQPAQPHNSNLLTLRHSPVAHRRKRRNAGAQQRRGSRQIQVRRNLQHKQLRHYNALRVTPVGHPTRVLIRKVISQREVRAELLQPLLALADKSHPNRPYIQPQQDPRP